MSIFIIPLSLIVTVLTHAQQSVQLITLSSQCCQTIKRNKCIYKRRIAFTSRRYSFASMLISFSLCWHGKSYEKSREFIPLLIFFIVSKNHCKNGVLLHCFYRQQLKPDKGAAIIFPDRFYLSFFNPKASWVFIPLVMNSAFLTPVKENRYSCKERDAVYSFLDSVYCCRWTDSHSSPIFPVLPLWSVSSLSLCEQSVCVRNGAVHCRLLCSSHHRAAGWKQKHDDQYAGWSGTINVAMLARHETMAAVNKTSCKGLKLYGLQRFKCHVTWCVYWLSAWLLLPYWLKLKLKAKTEGEKNKWRNEDECDHEAFKGFILLFYWFKKFCAWVWLALFLFPLIFIPHHFPHFFPPFLSYIFPTVVSFPLPFHPYLA